MKITGWTNEEYAVSHYTDCIEERLKLLNPQKKFLTPKELEEKAKEKGMSKEDFYILWHKEYMSLPTYTDEKKAQEWNDLYNQIEKLVINHCKEKGIRFSATYHQYGEFGIPIIDDKYMFETYARTWGRIMAEADNDFSDKGYLRYYIYSDKEIIKYPNEVAEERCF